MISNIELIVPDKRVVVTRTQYLAKILELISIEKNHMEIEHLTQPSLNPIIPYYVVGIDENQEQMLKEHIAEIIFAMSFEQSQGQDRPIAGMKASQAVETRMELRMWARVAPPLTQAERDFIVEWCNPIHLMGGGIFLWGRGVYINGHWHQHGLTCNWVKLVCGYDQELHRLECDQ